MKCALTKTLSSEATRIQHIQKVDMQAVIMDSAAGVIVNEAELIVRDSVSDPPAVQG